MLNTSYLKALGLVLSGR